MCEKKKRDRKAKFTHKTKRMQQDDLAFEELFSSTGEGGSSNMKSESNEQQTATEEENDTADDQDQVAGEAEGYVELQKLDAMGRNKERKNLTASAEKLPPPLTVDTANGNNSNESAPIIKKKLTLDDFTLLKLVGKGGYGKVAFLTNYLSKAINSKERCIK